MEAITIQCSNKDCRIAEDGKCVEGLARDVCPNFGHEPAAVESDGEVDEPETWSLSAAERLSKKGAAAILRRDTGRVVAIIGPHDAGKTSLIAGLYDLFQDGPINDFQFSGSQTLHAFEISCHDARDASGRTVPHINRTPLGDAEFFHLGIDHMPNGIRVALLIGDRAGEDYLSAANNVQAVCEFFEVKRADTLTFLVDACRLLDPVSRHQARNEVLRTAQAMVDGGATSAKQRVAVVLTKVDEIRGSADEVRVMSDFYNVVAQLRTNFASKFSAIEPFETAALPKKTAAARGTGLSELLNYWLAEQNPFPYVAPNAMREERVFRRLKAG